jgi:hypothetical protein
MKAKNDLVIYNFSSKNFILYYQYYLKWQQQVMMEHVKIVVQIYLFGSK